MGKMELNKIHNIDALEGLKQLPDNYIDCVMTSPPYWALRDYGIEPHVWDAWDKKTGKCWNQSEHSFNVKAPPRRNRNPDDVKDSDSIQAGNIGSQHKLPFIAFCSKCQAWKGSLGLEPTFDLYIKHLCDIFDEVKRVMKKEGTCWVNLGDTYSNKDSGGDNVMGNPEFARPHRENVIRPPKETQLPSKSLTLIPFRFAIEMINRGWILRNTIIWQKPNCMPSSAKDRFTVDFEYLFFFVKQKKYFFEAQYEPQLESSIKRYQYEFPGYPGDIYPNEKRDSPNNFNGNRMIEGGRNKRTVWSICPQPFPEAHFAVYPEELCETPIKAGCPEFVCKKCGKAKEKLYDYEKEGLVKCNARGELRPNTGEDIHFTKSMGYKEKYNSIPKFKGYTNCNCNTGFKGGIVLDPFIGAGTTVIVALKQSKQFIGFEINKEYIEIANKRIKPYLEQTNIQSFRR